MENYIADHAWPYVDRYAHEMPNIGVAQTPKDWFLQHANTKDRVRMVAACLTRFEAEMQVHNLAHPFDQDKMLCAQTLLSNLDETDPQRELTREAYDRMSKNLERDEQIAYVACAKAHATWKAIGMGVATKCLSWINTLNLATRHELEPSPRHA